MALLPRTQALVIAERVLELLRPACERVELAGSLRRLKPVVHDIDVLAIPRVEPVTDLFGEVVGSRLPIDDALAQAALAHAAIEVLRSGPFCRILSVDGVTCEIWFADPVTWGCRMAIRTGSQDFSHWLVTHQSKGGACPDDLRFQGGRLWRGDQVLDTPLEPQVFDQLGLAWIEPEYRMHGRWPARPIWTSQLGATGGQR